MSEYRLRQGHHDPRNLWRYHIDETPESKSGMCVGRVDYASLAEEIVAAVNVARQASHHDDPITNTIHSALMELHPDADKSNVTGDWQALRDDAEHIATRVRDAVRAEVEDLTHDYEEQYRRDQQDLMNATDREDDLRSGVWIMPGLKGGQACVGGTRVPAADVADLMADGVGADGIADYYPSVTPEGARAAEAFADRFVDRHARDRRETDPRTEVEAHAGGDPERIVQAWEADRDRRYT